MEEDATLGKTPASLSVNNLAVVRSLANLLVVMMVAKASRKELFGCVVFIIFLL